MVAQIVHRLAVPSVALLLVGACAPAARPAPAETPSFASAPPDTIVLVRTRCFGTCPAYELVMARGGPVRVRGDRERAARVVATVPDAVMDALGRQALAGGFYTLPSRTGGDRTLCPMAATDHATITVRIAQARQSTEVVHYTGCVTSTNPRRIAPTLRALEALADSIDVAAGLGPPSR